MYFPTIQALDKHATIQADKLKVVSAKFHELFAQFIDSLVESNYADGYLEDKASKLSNAYWVFINCVSDEVKTIKDITQRE